jgi:hypothetical protein
MIREVLIFTATAYAAAYATTAIASPAPLDLRSFAAQGVTAAGGNSFVEPEGEAYAFDLQPDGTYVKTSLYELIPESERNPNPGSEEFGERVAVHGDTIAVSSRLYGGVYLFKRARGNWSFDSKVDSGESFSVVSFGDSLALSSNHLVVGAPDARAPGSRASSTGAFFVFENTPQGWVRTRAVWGKDDSRLGWSVAISDLGFAAGAPAGPGEEYVHLELFATSGKNKTYILHPSDSEQYTKGSVTAFGRSLSMGGLSLAVGAPLGGARPGEPMGTGQVYLYSMLGPDSPYVISAPEADTWLRTAERWFGKEVALSADGDTLLVAAPGERTRRGVYSHDGILYAFSLDQGGTPYVAYLDAEQSGNGRELGRRGAVGFLQSHPFAGDVGLGRESSRILVFAEGRSVPFAAE